MKWGMVWVLKLSSFRRPACGKGDKEHLFQLSGLNDAEQLQFIVKTGPSRDLLDFSLLICIKGHFAFTVAQLPWAHGASFGPHLHELHSLEDAVGQTGIHIQSAFHEVHLARAPGVKEKPNKNTNKTIDRVSGMNNFIPNKTIESAG